MIPLRVKYATLLASGLHGIIILISGSRLGYDAYNHMFFADHYLRSWWTLWEPRWYTGFQVVSYPPLVHQLNALLARLIGISAGYALLLWLVVCLYPWAIYRFSRLFSGERAASNAAVGAALLPSIYLSAHTFGQLPTLTASLLALLAMPVMAEFLLQGKILSGALTISIFATIMATHHATLLFLPWLVAAVFLRLFLQRKTNKPQILVRQCILLVCASVAGLAVIWPFWNWGRGQEIQSTIDHASRHNFLTDPSAAGMFFLPEYGLLIPLIPFALCIGKRKRFWGLTIAFIFLFILGLGGTTPLPRLIFGVGWAWLTYDRFAFWASLILLPLFGTIITLGKSILFPIRLVFFSVMTGTALVIGFMPSWLPTQPRQLDMQPIVDFLAQDDHARYRYLTFGFGDQLAYLSRLTDATTIDGSYHTARSLPELRASGIGQIDTAFWFPNGLDALDPILKKSSERGVRWAFVDLAAYTPVLERNGWMKLTELSNNVEVWENPSAGLPPVVEPPPESPFAQFSWGVFPLVSLFLSGGLAIRRYWPTYSTRIFYLFQVFAIGLLPFGLTFWYFRTVFAFPHAHVYFTYTDSLFFLCDALVIVAVLSWLGQKRLSLGFETLHFARLRELFITPTGWLLCVCLLVSLSTFWSLDWRISLYFSVHLWLLFAFFLTLQDTPFAWRWFMLGSCAALCAQIIIGIWQFAAQSTAISLRLGLDWPGSLLPSISGASVVQLANGLRWLRAYGSLPHPNLLGGFGLVLLAGPLTLYLLLPKFKILTIILFGIGIALLGLTFSRSAWLGVVILLGVMIIRRKIILIQLLVLPLLAVLFAVGFLVARLYPLFFTRLADTQVKTEQVSIYSRIWSVQRTVELIRLKPFLGSGAGTYSLALSNHVPEFTIIEPAHNILLLVTAELGFGGAVLMLGLMVSVLRGIFLSQDVPAVVFSGILIGLFAISCLDHYLWTLAPGRILFFTVLGIWTGQVRVDARGG